MTTGVNLLKVNSSRIKSEMMSGGGQQSQYNMGFQSTNYQPFGRTNLIEIPSALEEKLGNVAINPFVQKPQPQVNYTINALNPSGSVQNFDKSSFYSNIEKLYQEHDKNTKFYVKYFQDYFNDNFNDDDKIFYKNAMNFLKTQQPPTKELIEMLEKKKNFLNYFYYLEHYIGIYYIYILNIYKQKEALIDNTLEKLNKLLDDIKDGDDIDIQDKDLNLNDIPLFKQYWIDNRIIGTKMKGKAFKKIVENFKKFLDLDKHKEEIKEKSLKLEEDYTQVKNKINYDKFHNYVDKKINVT